MLVRFLYLAAFFTLVVGFIQEVTFYTEPGYQGYAYRFRTKEADLTPHYTDLLLQVKSYCYIGSWNGYYRTNFTSERTFSPGSAQSMTCDNGTFPETQSLRYFGPLNVTTPSISVYPGVYAGGPEITIMAPAANNFEFLPNRVVLTGASSWTGFENNNFTGLSHCYSSTLLIQSFNSYPYPTRSIIRGCDPIYNSRYVHY
ncbi:uncharacterized protein LOC110862256 [Folsomia candida]|uniref:uncharacterized protein LOC110862256 n=1 Tax=Folsomia candida TaxID=158441 RepID=UPI000B8FD21F|nr:uncharacterized protein LOC110862256 [Folsomia candida]